MIAALFTFALCFVAPATGLENVSGAGRALTGVGGLAAPEIVSDIMPEMSLAQIGFMVVGVFFLVMLLRALNSVQRDLAKNVTEAVLSHLQKKAPGTHLEGQPIAVEEAHPCVKEPDFITHKDQIWKVVNGIRAGLSRVETAVATSNVLREANGERLGEVANEMSGMRKQFDHLAGTVEQFMKEDRKK